MHVLEPYIKYIENLTSNLQSAWENTTSTNAIELALNGELSKTLRNLVPAEELQKAGAFFTSESMADMLVGHVDHFDHLRVCDSACGGGNLLLAYAKKLPLSETLNETLLKWSSILIGADIHNEFVRATRARLVLLAVLRGTQQYGKCFIENNQQLPPTFLTNFFTHDSLVNKWPEANIYLLNPPFNSIPVPPWCKWATGKVSQAALFISKCIDQSTKGTQIKAILPDVLRSGTRYAKWRKYIEKNAKVTKIKILGQFDAKTQVDVFLLSLTVGQFKNQKPADWLQLELISTESTLLGDLCDIKVGRVVPHRDKEEGPLLPYLNVNQLPRWTTLQVGNISRCFSGRTFETPFVAVKRNSKAKDPHRAVGSIIKSIENQSQHVAVENHLIIIKPKQGSNITCEDILQTLQDVRTTEWLNKRIRCRHLTVSSLQNIPWWLNE